MALSPKGSLTPLFCPVACQKAEERAEVTNDLTKFSTEEYVPTSFLSEVHLTLMLKLLANFTPRLSKATSAMLFITNHQSED